MAADKGSLKPSRADKAAVQRIRLVSWAGSDCVDRHWRHRRVRMAPKRKVLVVMIWSRHMETEPLVGSLIMSAVTLTRSHYCFYLLGEPSDGGAP